MPPQIISYIINRINSRIVLLICIWSSLMTNESMIQKIIAFKVDSHNNSLEICMVKLNSSTVGSIIIVPKKDTNKYIIKYLTE